MSRWSSWIVSMAPVCITTVVQYLWQSVYTYYKVQCTCPPPWKWGFILLFLHAHIALTILELPNGTAY